MTINANDSESASPHQKRNDVAVTSSAFGIINSIVLSINSIVVIEIVSVAIVILIASFDVAVCFRTPR